MRRRAEIQAGFRFDSLESNNGATGSVTAFWQRKKTSLMLWCSLALVRIHESISLYSAITGNISSSTIWPVGVSFFWSDLFAQSTTGTLTPSDLK